MSTDAPTNTRRGRKPRLSNWAAIGLIAAASLGVGGVAYTRGTIESIAVALPATPDLATLPVSTEIVDRNGLLLRPFTTDGRWRLPVSVDQVDRRFIDMLIAYEDQRFATHHGIDWSGMARAAVQFATAGGKIVSGGSTLTMQVARLLETGTTRSLDAKIRQMVHADKLEAELSKDQIVTLYLTLAPYGGNIEGVRAASLAYFGKEPTRLTTAEAALLVALPQSPEARRPDINPATAKLSRDTVLDRMVTAGLIMQEEADAAKGEPIPTARREFPMLAAHLAQEATAA
ncbi:MAG: transglycosylase domain-containing protein, partial [Devosia sp.]